VYRLYQNRKDVEDVEDAWRRSCQPLSCVSDTGTATGTYAAPRYLFLSLCFLQSNLFPFQFISLPTTHLFAMFIINWFWDVLAQLGS
jgi:hypothetical protein